MAQAVSPQAFETMILPYLVVLPFALAPAFWMIFRYKFLPKENIYLVARKFAQAITKPAIWAKKIFQRTPKTNLILPVIAIFASAVVFQTPFFLIHVVTFTLNLKEVGNALSVGYVILSAYALYVSFLENSALDEKAFAKMSAGKDLNLGMIVKPFHGKLNLSWKDINHHIHVLGQPGSGKSVLLRNFYAHQIMSGEGLLMIDLKADLDVKAEIKGLALKAKREKDLVIIDLSNPEKSASYNPLLRGNASELKDKIMSALDWSEVFYKKLSEKFLLNILNGLVVARDQLQLTPTLEDLSECLTSPDSLIALADKIKSVDPIISMDLMELVKKLKEKTIDMGLTGIQTDIEVMLKSNFGSILLSSNAMDMLDAIQSKKIVLINLDGQTYRETAVRLGRMIISDLRSASGAIVSSVSQEERPTFTVIVDEFADIITSDSMCDEFVSLLSRCRGSGIGVIMAHQSLGDFKDERSRTRVLDSTETTISFLQKDPKSCEILAGIVGTKETTAVTEQTSKFLFFDVKTGKGTERVTQEFIFHPNHFKNLNIGEAIYMAKRPSRAVLLKVKSLEVPKCKRDLPVAASTHGSNERFLSLRKERESGVVESSFAERLGSIVRKQADI